MNCHLYFWFGSEWFPDICSSQQTTHIMMMIIWIKNKWRRPRIWWPRFPADWQVRQLLLLGLNHLRFFPTDIDQPQTKQHEKFEGVGTDSSVDGVELVGFLLFFPEFHPTPNQFLVVWDALQPLRSWPCVVPRALPPWPRPTRPFAAPSGRVQHRGRTKKGEVNDRRNLRFYLIMEKSC